MLVLSLFPGLGLLDHAFEVEGFTVVRGPDVLWGGDVRAFRPPAGKFDGVIGGPPCQSFSSLVHLVRANGHEPKFGNLIPEFERCVREALPTWFVMENVPQAPEPEITGYGVKSFLLDNSALNGGDGFGLEQRRVRRFSFGLNADRMPPSLLRWIDLAVFLLPDATRTVTALGVDHLAGLARSTQEYRTAHECVNGSHGVPPSVRDKRTRQVTVTSTDGGVRPSERRRVNAVLGASSQNEGCLGATKKTKQRAVSASNGGRGSKDCVSNAGKGRYKLADAIRLQGLPEDFLEHAPFTAEGKLKAVANGVPIPMGRAIAKAVREAMSQ